MATHFTVPSMLKESLVEMFLVARDCIDFRKDPILWGSSGCYGYPAAILLFSIADSIGSYVVDGSNVERHFDILNYADYYNLKLEATILKDIYTKFRSTLTHNAVMPPGVKLVHSANGHQVFEVQDKTLNLHLVEFLDVTQKALDKFLENSDNIVENSNQLRTILKK